MQSRVLTSPCFTGAHAAARRPPSVSHDFCLLVDKTRPQLVSSGDTYFRLSATLPHISKVVCCGAVSHDIASKVACSSLNTKYVCTYLTRPIPADLRLGLLILDFGHGTRLILPFTRCAWLRIRLVEEALPKGRPSLFFLLKTAEIYKGCDHITVPRRHRTHAAWRLEFGIRTLMQVSFTLWTHMETCMKVQIPKSKIQNRKSMSS
jgi:hypothetical protein